MPWRRRNLLVIGLVIFGLLGLSFFFFAFFLTLFSGGEGVWQGGQDKIALIPIQGAITDSRSVIKQLQRFGDDNAIKAIILRIESPGGGVVPSQEIYREVVRVREQGKQVVASLGGVAASGGYYIAVAAEPIFANPGTITGSIGVILHLPNVEELLQKIGLKVAVIKSGAYKDIASPVRPLGEAEREILQGLISDVHDQFIEAVARGRNLQVAEVRKIADGRVFSGRRAQELGLVDQLGSLRDTILATAKLVGISGEPTIVQEEDKGLLWYLLREALPWSTVAMGYLRDSPYQLQYIWQ